ncbi:MAG: hypothetical protein ABIN48_00185 [Ginsengibacter sp.]
MKALIFSIFISAALIGCNTSTDSAMPEMPGVYFMQSQIIDNGTEKTTLKDLNQLKLFTDKYFMYVQANRRNSIYSFGLGTYSVSDSGLVLENAIYSASDSIFNSEPRTYRLNITTNYDGYKQVIPEIVIAQQKSILTEEYKRAGKNTTTPLDGVWKETNFYIVNGSDTVSKERTQFKAFYNGYFMYGQYYLNDSTNHYTTGMGYGTFKMESDHQIKETDLNSSYNIVPGAIYTIEIEMINENSYKQTLIQPDGSKHIEVYQRLKS